MKTNDELLDLIEDLVVQACTRIGSNPVVYDHSFISTYEYAMEVLVECRPKQWKLTAQGMAECPGS